MNPCDRCGDSKETYNMRTGGSRCCYSLSCNRRRELIERGAAIGFGIAGMFRAIQQNYGHHIVRNNRAHDLRQIDLEDYIRDLNEQRSKT